MSGSDENTRGTPRSAALAKRIGVVAALVTAAAVSWATPDGNLVVTGVPTLVVGFSAYGVASWWARRRGRRQPPPEDRTAG